MYILQKYFPRLRIDEIGRSYKASKRIKLSPVLVCFSFGCFLCFMYVYNI